MVIPIMRMDKARRNKYSLIASVMHGICAVLAFFSALYTFSVSIILLKGVIQLMSQRNLTSYIPIVITVIFFGIGFIHLWSMMVFANQRNEISRWRGQWLTDLMLVLFLSITCAAFVVGASGFFWYKFAKYLSHGIFVGIDNYESVLSERKNIDFLQSYFECCGINGYEDWSNTGDHKKMNLYAAQNKLNLTNHFWKHCTSNGCYISHSCCQANQLRCSSRILQRNLTMSVEAAERKANEWFHPEGCVQKLQNKVFTTMFITLSLVNLIVQLITSIYSQISSTGYYILDKCDCNEDTILPAWIIPYWQPSPDNLIKICNKRLEEGLDYDDKAFETFSIEELDKNLSINQEDSKIVK